MIKRILCKWFHNYLEEYLKTWNVKYRIENDIAFLKVKAKQLEEEIRVLKEIFKSYIKDPVSVSESKVIEDIKRRLIDLEINRKCVDEIATNAKIL